MASDLVVVLDLNAYWWGKLVESQGNPKLVAELVYNVSSFCCTHLCLSAANRLLLLAAGLKDSTKRILYDSSTESNDDIGQVLTNKIMDALQSSIQANNVQTESKIAGPLASSLCYIKQRQTKLAESKSTWRILVVKLSDDDTNQHLSMMNAFFAAQKLGVAVDCCMVLNESALMQQACDITGGRYLKIEDPLALLPSLIVVFLPDCTVRPKLRGVASGDIDYRPACFCHQTLVEVGWVCSVCLSVFCNFTPICETCQTAFKFVPVLPRTKKRKKEKAQTS